MATVPSGLKRVDTRLKGLRTTQSIMCYLTKHPEASIREIARACHISSTSVVNYHLDKLERAGYIEHATGRSRARRVLVPMFDPIGSTSDLAEPVPAAA